MINNLKLHPSTLEEFKAHLGTAGMDYQKALNNYMEQKEKEAIIQLSGVAESIIGEIYKKKYDKSSATLVEMTDRLTAGGVIPAEIGSAVHYIRILANKIRHNALKAEVTLFDTENCLRLCYRVIIWHLHENKNGPLLNKDIFCSTGMSSPTSYPEKVRLLSNLINHSDVTKKVLSSLLNSGPASVDELTTRLNLSRMVIVQSLTKLLEKQIVCFEESGSDVLTFNPESYNIEYIIEGIISDG